MARRRKHYKTGVHYSPKCPTEIRYRSSWELAVCIFLDSENTVKFYGYESVPIFYISNLKTGKIRTYLPDFLISYTDGTKKLVEVKRKDRLNHPKVLKKAKAAEMWAKANNVQYEFWCDSVIAAIKKINEARQPKPGIISKKTHRKRKNTTRTRKK